MSSVFISLYLDEDVNVLVADLLRARGFDAITARDAGKLQDLAVWLRVCVSPLTLRSQRCMNVKQKADVGFPCQPNLEDMR